MVNKPWPSGSDGFELGEVLGVDEADRFALGIDDDEVVNVPLVEDVDGVGGEGVLAQADRLAGHHLGQRLAEHAIALGQVAAQVAVGEDAGQFAAFVDHADAAGLGLTHDEQCVTDDGGLRGHRVARATAHDVGYLEQQCPADGTARVAFRKFRFFEAASVEHGHGEGVTHDERGGGAGGGGHVEGAGLLWHFDVEHDLGVFSQRGARRRGHGDDLHGESPDGRQKVDQLVGLAGVAQGEQDVAVVEDAEVAVHGVDGVEQHGGRAGAGEGGGDLAADVAGFADAEDDDFLSLGQGGDDQFHRLIE